MATVAEIKAKLKADLDASAEFGSVLTEDTERIPEPKPAAVTMFHDGGAQVPESNTSAERTTNLTLFLLVPFGAQGKGADVVMQQTFDTKLEVLLRVIRLNPTLATNGIPLVMSCFAQSWENSVEYDDNDKPIRMQSEVRVAVTYEEG